MERLRAPRLDAVRRVKSWAASRFGSQDDVWLVTEVQCRVDGQPPSQTVIALLHPAASLTFRIAKPLAEIEQADIASLGDTSAALAAEACC